MADELNVCQFFGTNFKKNMGLSDIGLSTKKSSDAYSYNHLNESFMSNIQGRSVKYRTVHYLWYCSQLLNLQG